MNGVLNVYKEQGFTSHDVVAKVKKILEEQNFQPSYEAQCLSTKKTWTLGLVYFESLEIGLKHPFLVL